MATRMLLISDTHVPGRARRIPDAVRAAADRVDLIVHAGDWVAASVVHELAALNELVGVYGNNDGLDLRALLPEVARREIEGQRFAVVHETGAATARGNRMDAAFPDVDVLVFGHSHIPWDSVSPKGDAAAQPGITHRPSPSAPLQHDDAHRGCGRAPGCRARAAVSATS